MSESVMLLLGFFVGACSRLLVFRLLPMLWRVTMRRDEDRLTEKGRRFFSALGVRIK